MAIPSEMPMYIDLPGLKNTTCPSWGTSDGTDDTSFFSYQEWPLPMPWPIEAEHAVDILSELHASTTFDPQPWMVPPFFDIKQFDSIGANPFLFGATLSEASTDASDESPIPSKHVLNGSAPDFAMPEQPSKDAAMSDISTAESEESLLHSKDNVTTMPPPGLEHVQDQICDTALVNSMLLELLGDEDDIMKLAPACPGNRWWTKHNSLLLCPLTNFPIHLLPYPPFKLRLQPDKPSPYKLVDGRHLAMQVIVNYGDFKACGRRLQSSDVAALDDYIRRCKLGPYRPGRSIALMNEANSPKLAAASASQKLKLFVSMARSELSRLKRIQENRLQQLHTQIQKSKKGAAVEE